LTTHDQRYDADTSDVAVTEMANASLGLRVRAWTFVLPNANVLVNHYQVTRAPGSPVHRTRLIFYTNLDPTLARLPFFPKLLVTRREDEELTQLATRIPLRTARRLKAFCVQNEVRVQTFVRSALAEKLAHARARARRQRSRA
jgi:hypothetical protein